MEILYEDNHLLFVDKKPGDLVQSDITGDEPLISFAKKYIKKVYNKPGDVFLGLIHRLDRPVSGVIVFARTSKALERMNTLFRSKEVKKTYWAIITKRPVLESETLVHHIVKDLNKNRVHVHDNPKNNTKEAILHYKLLGRIGGHYLLEISLETGRSHQIRAQLAKIGCPIKGDRKYGCKIKEKDNSICLHAKSLSFVHPVKKEPVMVSTPIPMTSPWQSFWEF